VSAIIHANGGAGGAGGLGKEWTGSETTRATSNGGAGGTGGYGYVVVETY
jgi:hypothetical protein